MRELTKYEKNKWYDEWNRFTVPEFIGYGDELGETYDALVHAEKHADYISDELTEALQTEILNMYYDDLLGILMGSWGHSPEDYRLPTFQQVKDQFPGVFGEDDDPVDKRWLEAMDWAMDWRAKSK